MRTIWQLCQVAARGPTRADALRALAVLERVAADVGTAAPDLAQQLSNALLPILTPGNSHGRGKRADEAASARVLAVLAAVWSRAAEAGGEIPACASWALACAHPTPLFQTPCVMPRGLMEAVA